MAGWGVGKLVGKLLPRVVGAINKACSFSADTPVSTPDGDKPIGQVRVGDHVQAWNEATGTTGSYTVTAVLSHNDPLIVHLTLGGETLQTTPEHPFYT